ncbi:MAG: YicC family protein [Hahellaceae bacterium]|nr:YicC family protein [Hahellaceae bacterium]MCP5209624.1 YicC family protein [Hahellaceae bacterium]
MIRSMTAFARVDLQESWGALTWELRSVNHRYLEPHFKLPDNLRELEPQLREKQRKFLNRGKIESALRFQANDEVQGKLEINSGLLTELNNVINQVNRVLDNPAHVVALDVMRWPGVLSGTELDMTPIRQAALKLYDQALKQLLDTRATEGARLAPLFTERLDQIDTIVDEVKERLPQILQAQSDNLRKRLEDASVELDEGRLEQEMVMLAAKSDVAEELDRLIAHTQEVRSVLSRKEPIGRRLDFLMQELNREANTLSSKSIVTETTRAAVDLKVLIEQMREQVQNIE